MKLRITLEEGTAPRDILVTADATATIGDIAAALSGGRIEGQATLGIRPPGSSSATPMSPLLGVHESPLRSGATVVVEPVRPTREPAGLPAAMMTIDSGPDARATFALDAGVSYIGRDPSAEVRVTDPLASRRHASVTVADTVVIADANSANGVEVDGALVERAELSTGSVVRIGGNSFTVTVAPHPVPTLGGRGAAAPSSFTRSPRVEPFYAGATLVAPEVPAAAAPARFPLLAVVAPVAMGAVLFAVTRQATSLLFVALSPLIMFGTWVDGRVQARRTRRAAHAGFDESLAAFERAIADEHGREREARESESPTSDLVVDAIRGRTALLWTRKPEHGTFLEVRFGTGRMPSRGNVTPPSKNSGAAGSWERVTALADAAREVRDAPVLETMARAGAIGVAGAPAAAAGVARSLVIQLTGLQAPHELAIAAIVGQAVSAEWDWLKWLPHVGSPAGPVTGPALASDYASASLLLAELEEVVSVRRGRGAPTGVRSRLGGSIDLDHGRPVERLPQTPALVLLVAGDPPADVGRLVSLADDGPDAGVFVIWLAAEAAALPSACRTYVEVGDDGARAGFVRSGVIVALSTVETLDHASAASAARLLAPVEDSGAQALDESDLPRSVAFLELFDERVADSPQSVVQRWTKNDSVMSGWHAGVVREPGGLRAVVGQGAAGPVFLDLRRHGPHALVGGTTGSGKSEFLQSWIMGLATEYSPDRVTFLLVDYKGGSAFADCVGLPHTVGLVTDLTGHLVHRALTSLRAELRYRERLLNAKGAKDLETLERRSDPDAPPALVIVIDEFAALATEMPEFIDGIIDVGQRGRSLGLHLVMATQRPAGVIKDSLRANTNLRIALRVADEADSLDVLGVPTAAWFDAATPGRAAAKVGPGRVIDLQAAYLGGRTPQTSRAAAEVTVGDLGFGPVLPWVSPGAGARGEGGPRDIERLAGAISSAAGIRSIATPRKPWLDQLPVTHDLLALPQSPGGALVIGLLDEPAEQRQGAFAIDLDADGNIGVFGTGGSGKSALLRTVALAVSRSAGTHPVVVYGLDFAGGALAGLDVLPTVGGIIDGNDHERIARLISMLTVEAAERADAFSAARAATLDEFRALAHRPELPRIIVLIDGMSAFRADYEFRDSGARFDEIGRLMSIGRQVGIHFILSADRLAAVPSAMLAALPSKVAMRLASESDYAALGVPSDALVDAPAGRGFVARGEVQFSVAGGSTDLAGQSGATNDLAAHLIGAGVAAVTGVARLPELIPLDSLPVTSGGRPTIGVSDETLASVGLPLDGIFVVSGPFGSGRTTAMSTIVRSIRRARPELGLYLLVARRSDLAGVTEWVGSSTDAEEADTLAVRLAEQLESPEGPRSLVIVVENIGDFEGLPAEQSVARLVRAARRAGVTVIAETDTVTGTGAWQLFSELKAARAGIVLQPEETDGVSLFRTQFPRVTRTDFPVGRGMFVDSGRLSRVQVAIVE